MKKLKKLLIACMDDWRNLDTLEKLGFERNELLQLIAEGNKLGYLERRRSERGEEVRTTAEGIAYNLGYFS